MKKLVVLMALCLSLFICTAAHAAITVQQIYDTVYERYPDVRIYSMGEMMNDRMEVYAVDVRFHNESLSGKMIIDYNDCHIISEEVEYH